MNDKEKIESYKENIAESLRILDEIVEIIRFQLFEANYDRRR